MEIDRAGIVEALQPLGFQVQDAPAQAGALAVTTPPWREDVVEEADLVEEIARMIGYDRVPETLLRGGVPTREVERGLYWWRRLRPFLLSCGLSEANNHPLTGDAALERLRGSQSLTGEPLWMHILG